MPTARKTAESKADKVDGPIDEIVTDDGQPDEPVKNPDAGADHGKGDTETVPDVEGDPQEPSAEDLNAAAPQDIPEPVPGPALEKTGDLSRKGLVEGTTGKPVRYYKFDNELGAKVWAGDADGEFRVAALNPDGVIIRRIEGAPRLPASLPTADVNKVLELVADLTP